MGSRNTIVRIPPTARLVVALGGNAILRHGDDGTIETQYLRASRAMSHIAPLARAGHALVLTHGNGPVVGNIVLRNEAARAMVAPMPLYIAGADSEGGIGVMLQMTLGNALRAADVSRDVATVITQTVVDADDPAFERPTKPIGPYYSAEKVAAMREAEPTWVFVDTPDCGWRRAVASPLPTRIVEAPVIERLVASGVAVIAAGGGGVPVLESPDGVLCGVDAVVDKDWSSALLARDIDADALVILMEEDRLYLGWSGPEPRAVERLSPEEASGLVASGALETGSVAPKVAACASFSRETGRPAIICRVEDLESALRGEAGTRVS
jgi:carbamate kinase